MKLIALVIFFKIVGPVISDQVKYSGYKVFSIKPRNENEVKVLRELGKLGMIFWNGPNPTNRSSEVMVPPHLLHVIYSVGSNGFDISEHISDVQRMIDKTSRSVVSKREGVDFDFTAYHTFEDIIVWLKEQATAHSDIASAFSIGSSYEGRELLVFKISKPSEYPKRAIWIDSNIHAREWITSAVSVYIINELINGHNPIFLQWVEDFDWYFLPVHNPDGFEFSHTNNRLWRKTRSETKSTIGCKGADANRNWNFNWLTGGSSTDPCSDTYAGPNAFSEPETNCTSQFISQIAHSLDGFISLHSYGQLILLPDRVNNSVFAGQAVQMEIGTRIAAGIEQKYGTQFTPGNILDLLYVASGGSIDWVAGVHNVPLTYTFELRDKGTYGFLLPANQIVSSAQELLDGIAVILDAIRARISQSIK